MKIISKIQGDFSPCIDAELFNFVEQLNKIEEVKHSSNLKTFVLELVKKENIKTR